MIELAAGGAAEETAAASGAAVRALTRASRILERTPTALSMADFRMLSAVAEGEGRATRLAARLALGKPAVSASVESLVRRGLLERGSNDTDQRAVVLAITPAGERLRGEAEHALVQVVGELAALTPDPAATLAALGALGDAIEERQAARAVQHRLGCADAPAQEETR